MVFLISKTDLNRNVIAITSKTKSNNKFEPSNLEASKKSLTHMPLLISFTRKIIQNKKLELPEKKKHVVIATNYMSKIFRQHLCAFM